MRPKKKKNIKTLQLAGQIFHSVQFYLDAQSSNPLFERLQLISVLPHKGISSFLVLLTYSGSETPSQILKHLKAKTGEIRFEIGSSINRGKVPDIKFEVIPTIQRDLG